MALRLAVFSILLLCATRPAAVQSKSAEDDSRIEQLYSEAKSAEARGDFDTAVAKYEAILHIAPRLGPAYNNLGAVYFKHRDYPKAAAVLEQGLRVNPAMPSASALL